MLPNQQQSQEPRGEAAAASKEEKVQEEAKPKAQAKGKDFEAQDDQKTDDEVEQPSFGRPQNFQPHGSSGDLKKEVEVHNNLTVAVEVNAGTGWKALYPEGRVRFETPSVLDVAMLFCFTCLTALCVPQEAQTPAALEEKSLGEDAGKIAENHDLISMFSKCTFVLAGAWLIVIAVMQSINGFPLVILILAPPLLVLCIFRWGVGADLTEEDKSNRVQELTQKISKNTIVFEGRVLGSNPCVCSWPGKYMNLRGMP